MTAPVPGEAARATLSARVSRAFSAISSRAFGNMPRQMPSFRPPFRGRGETPATAGACRATVSPNMYVAFLRL